ncbi:MAG TPA: hypothetical protein VHN14_04840 [Kofleriaceae bacterium]|nr:hypothetical protein [Kofleriaceae bacterium]
MALLPVGALAPGCSSDHVSSKGQLITCTTDPGTGVILRCQPGGGAGSGSNTCQDIDEDGDGDPHDEADNESARVAGASSDQGDSSDTADSDDHDGDGISDDNDCDEHEGEDGSSDGLPYDVRPKLGATTRPIIDAFAERGSQPAQIVSVTMSSGDTWRLAELQAGTAFVVTQADCDHAGNRATGRDRVTVTWKTADQTQSSDHLDIRYCD